MANPNKVKGILSVISAVLINLLTGNIFSFSNTIDYYQSYLYYKNINKTINKTTNNTIIKGQLFAKEENKTIPKEEEEYFNKIRNKLFFVAPVGIFLHNSLSSVTGYLDDILGTRILNIIGSISLLGSQLIVYFFTDYYLLIIAYILYGLCGSLTYFQSLKNCWKYFPNKKGLITGIIFSSFGLSAFAFTTLADSLINPDGIKKVNKFYYSAEISNKYLLFLKILIICIIALGLLSSILCFPYKKGLEEIMDEKLTVGDSSDELSINDDKGNKENHYSVQLKNEDKNNEKEEKDKESGNLTLKESIFSIDFFLCLSLAACTLVFGFLLTNTYRPFGSMKLGSYQEALKRLSQVFTILNTLSRLGWGYISDKIGFKILYMIVCINQLICGSLLYLSSEFIYTYYIVVSFGVLSFSGHFILFPSLIHKKFGVENSVYLLGICGIFAGIAALIGPVLSIFVLKKERDYLTIYLIGAAPTIISLIVTLIIKVDQNPKKETKNVDDNYDEDEEGLTDEKE